MIKMETKILIKDVSINESGHLSIFLEGQSSQVLFNMYFLNLIYVFWLNVFYNVLNKMHTLLHIVPFCKGPNKKSEGFAKEKQKTWRVCEGKKICQICDAERIATCGAPLITNLEWTFNHRRTFARYTTNKILRFV